MAHNYLILHVRWILSDFRRISVGLRSSGSARVRVQRARRAPKSRNFRVLSLCKLAVEAESRPVN